MATPTTTAAAAALCLSLYFSCVSVEAAKIPESWGTCKRNDPALGECLKNAIQKALPDLRSGSKILKTFGLMPLDPLDIKQVQVKQGAGPITMDMHLKDAQLSGLSSSTVVKVDPDLENNKLVIHTIVPDLLLKGQFNLTGRILVIPLLGEGDLTIHGKNVNVKMFVDGKRDQYKGQEVMRIDNYRFEMAPESCKFVIVSANKAQSDLLNKVLNDNSLLVAKEMAPALSTAFSPALLQFARRIMNKIPFDEIFPLE